MNEVLYYRIVDYHEEITGDGKPLTIEQLMNLVGTEISLSEYLKKEDKIDKKYIPYVKIHNFVNVGENVNIDAVIMHTSKSLQKYPWQKLADSLKENGMFVPVIAEKLVRGNRISYQVLEGKHRVTATLLIEPYDKDTLIPCLVVEQCDHHIS